MNPSSADADKDPTRRIAPWAAHARSWARVGPPLRPCPEDLQRLKEAWLASLPAGIPARRIEILVLGVTPEIATFPWAEQINLTAVDCSEDMIRWVWPGDTSDRKAVLNQWERMPFADASFDLIISDDGLAMVVELASLTAVARELRRLLKPDGRVVMRQFAQTTALHTEQSLVAATEAGEVQNFHGLKLRLLLMLDRRTPERGVRVGDVWECFERLFPDRDSLARRLGCDLETIATIDNYRGKDGRFSFRPLPELAQVFDHFRMAHGPPGHYPFAEYCPVFSLTPLR